MKPIVPQYAPSLESLQRATPLQQALVIGGKDTKAEAIAELRDGVTVEQAVSLVKKDRLDEVFFEAGGKHYVAYGKGMKLPFRLVKKEVNSSLVTPTGAIPARIIAVDDQMNSAGEGVVTTLKLLGVKSGIKIGVIGAAAGLAMMGAGKLSQSVRGVLLKSKNAGGRFLERAAQAMGTSKPVAGIIIGGTLLAAKLGIGALIAHRRKMDYKPVEGIIQNYPAGTPRKAKQTAKSKD